MKKHFLGLFAIALLFSGCASYHIRQGNRLYDDFAYSMAIKEYQKGLSKKEFPNARIKLAECYRKMNDYAHAEEAYSKAVQLPTAQPVHKLHYAQILMRNGKYEQAKTYFDEYIKAVPTDEVAVKLRASCDSVVAWKADSIKYSVKTSALNSGQSNFAPVIYKDGVVFATDRNTKAKTYEWTGKPYLEMYYAKGNSKDGYSSPTGLAGDVNGIYHDGPATFTTSGDTIYFTRNNYIKRKVKESSHEEVNLKIYQAIKKDTTWTGLKELPFNSDNYSTGHPAISTDGNTMYFVSDMPDGKGGSDIYMAKKVNEEWQTPVNLGAGINTPYNELFPVLWKDTVLYFSSEGHYNFGGLDIFKCVYRSGAWSDPVNVGYPINTSFDDFGIAMNDSGTAGLFSSNRNLENTTQDNIYDFTVNDLRFNLEGITVEKLTQKPLAGVRVELMNLTTGKKEFMVTEADGKFHFKLDPETDYSIVGSKDTYFTNTEKVSTKGKKQSESMFVKLKLELERIIVNKPIVLENIYYDLDKYAIRPDAAAGLDKLVGILNDNPGISIELGSHTDSRADDHYNDVLSQKRADAAVNYIIAHGISSSRITAKGYGEHQLINRCSNGVACSEEEHQANRRTEFKVVKMENIKP
jgi:peptidoglycan-associated lipoprotein